MKINNRFVFTFLTVFTVFAYSAMQTVPALADDGVPPVDAGASDSQPVVDSGSEEPAVPGEVTSQVPEGSTVVVLDETGNSVPLATQEAAQSLVDGDPMWCPAGVAPKDSTGGCSPAFSDFGSDGDSSSISLLGWLNANDPKKAGTIWVEYNYDSTAESNLAIVLDGANYDFLDIYALTVQGGWNGLPLSKLLDTADPYSYFTNSTFFVANWNNAVTLNNIAMDGVTINLAGPNQTLYVSTIGNIVLNNVIVQGSDNTDDSDPAYVFNGAILDNTTGTGTITVNNSDFSYNEGDGFAALSKGVITINGLVASFNGGSGAYIDNTGMQGKAVTLKGFKQFNNNGLDGLVVYSAGAITLSNIVANYNTDGNGVYLDNSASSMNLGVTIGGANYGMNNGENGIQVLSHGAITASNLNASGNDGSGAVFDNCDFNGSDCDLLLAKPVKLTGVNIFNNNGTLDEDGLIIRSFGAISVSNLIASDNVGDGAYIDNVWTNLSNIDSAGTWTLTGYGIFQNNGGVGLEGYSNGNMVLTNIDASYNGDDGMYLETDKLAGGAGLTLNGVNTFSENFGIGLNLLIAGTITINNVTASFNDGGGAVIFNAYLPTKPYNVTLKGTNTFKDNGNDGLVAVSYGSIVVSNLTANTNNGDGVYLDNCLFLFSACENPAVKPVTVNGYINTSDNVGRGFTADTTGVVTLNNITAEWNGEEGVVVLNDNDPSKGQAVTLKGSNTFNHNGLDGLQVNSYGAITINNITAFDNGDTGAYLVNSGSTAPKNITLTGTNAFVHNYFDGLYFEASGAAILSRVNADGNGWDTGPGNGIMGTAGTSILLTCAHTTNQATGSGYDLTAVTSITIKGIYSRGNNLADSTTAGTTTLITRPCALP